MDTKHLVVVELDEDLYRELQTFKASNFLDDDSKAVKRLLKMLLQGICNKSAEGQ